ncbi:alpha/beta hydrolase family protein [Kitasatospora sp. NPDC058162]|uniref:alpha/beta hydrolase family protein n=1 Tax=Kitasatospora sp. NPDC058162 TaxID=3346362 RepID=UPI0036DBA6A3
MTTARPETVPYADGRLLDVHRPTTAAASGPAPVVLLWHGSGPDERDVLHTLAQEAAGLGLLVLVPDWRPDLADGGRADLLASLAFARHNAAAYGGDPSRFVLAGWSLGGREAVAVATHPDTPAELRPTAAVGIASAYGRPATTTGDSPLEQLTAGPSPVPVLLVLGTADEVVPAELTHQLSAALTKHMSTAELLELPTDHAGVVMTVYDSDVRRCVPATDPATLAAGRQTAAVLARAAGLR